MTHTEYIEYLKNNRNIAKEGLARLNREQKQMRVRMYALVGVGFVTCIIGLVASLLMN